MSDEPKSVEGEVVSNLPVPGPGRDSKYRTEFNERARKLCLLGATDKELAEFFEVCEATINNWKTQFPAFLESIKAGKIAADAEVADSLYRRATGEYVFVERAMKTAAGDHQVISLRQFVPGDVQAQRLWLLNRSKINWRDKQEMEHSGKVYTEVAHRIIDGPAN
jgi:hypothetical protein